MRLASSFLLLATVSTLAPAQSPTFATLSDMSVFAQADQKTPSYDTHKAKTGITLTDARKLRADVFDGNATIVHARAAASLRIVGRHPIARIYETGLLPKLTKARQRALGTAATPGSAGTKVEPHTHLMRFFGSPGERVRIHSRLQTEIAGKDTGSATPTDIQGHARVDVGNDKSYEFDRTLDGKNWLGNHVVTVGQSGVVDIKVEVGALITSTGLNPASYKIVFDVHCEPIRGLVTSLEPYGPQCGPDVYGVTWTSGTRRHARTVLEGAAPSSPAMLIVGLGRFRLPLPGMNCQLLTLPQAILPSLTNAAGRIVTDFPTFSASLPVDVSFQYGVRTPAAINLSKGLGFRVQLDSPKAYDHFQVNHILSTGQSLAIGGLGTPVLSKKQGYNNVMFDNGLSGLSAKLAPLVEQTWETMSSGLTSTVSGLYKKPYNHAGTPPTNSHDLLVSVHARAGLPYINLKRGTVPFTQGISQFKMARFLAGQQNKSYVVRCVTNVHGETDHTHYNTDYGKNLLEWQADYESEIQALGQTEPVPMLHSQMSSFTRYGAKDSIIPPQQLDVSMRFPRRLPMVGPKYFLDYVDGVHLTSKGYRHMGEYYGKVYNHAIVEGATWEPLRPLAVKRNGAQIEIRFHVPAPPLVLDTTLVGNPGNYGFEYHDNSGAPPKIKTVYLLDEDTVMIELTAAPKATASKTIGYAFTGTPHAKAGPQSGARGNLRDNDRTPSLYGERLYNWCVHFRMAVR